MILLESYEEIAAYIDSTKKVVFFLQQIGVQIVNLYIQ